VQLSVDLLGDLHVLMGGAGGPVRTYNHGVDFSIEIAGAAPIQPAEGNASSVTPGSIVAIAPEWRGARK